MAYAPVLPDPSGFAEGSASMDTHSPINQARRRFRIRNLGSVSREDGESECGGLTKAEAALSNG